jgi:hypothetical protein
LGKSRKEIKDQMFTKDINVKMGDVPTGWSAECADFINKVTIDNLAIEKKKQRKAWKRRYT